jgi:sugar lactone lactonase YvrE
MFVKPSRFPAKDSVSKWELLCLPVLTLALSASSAWGQAPSIVVDAQQKIGNFSQGAQGVTVSKNGTVFIADTNNSQVLALNPKTGLSTPVSTGTTITLQSPSSLALDANGNLFVGDTPSGIGGRIVELFGDGKGNLNGTATTYFAGSPLVYPVSLAFDSSGTLFIGDYPSSGAGVIYSLPLNGTKLTALSFTGIPAQNIPSSLFRSGTNLYIADYGDGKTDIGGIYVAPAIGGSAQTIPTYTFTITYPTGIRLDAAGNIYILSYLGGANQPPTYNAGEQVVVVPAASPGTPYILPNGSLGYCTDMQLDPAGNLDVLDYSNGNVVQLTSTNPVDVGDKNNVGATGSPVQFNFEFNDATTLRGFSVVTQGDVSQELTQNSGGTCVNGKHTNLGSGGPAISPYYPYTCVEDFSGTPTYPGLRTSALQVKGASGTILASLPVYQTGLAGAEITYPLNQTSTATGLQQPQAVAISGLDKTVYVADSQAGVVYSIKGIGGSALTPVSTAPLSLSIPTALALDGAGNLFIADYDTAQVIEVPTTTGVAPSVINTGGLLQHPIALALDYQGNMYIGDAGPAGVYASYGNPGYVVKVPVGGVPFKMTISSSVQIVLPQSLATDPTTAALVIGDNGDQSSVGQVVQVSADGTTGTVIKISGVTNPSGLAFDAADQLYVLDIYTNAIYVVPPTTTGLATHLLEFDNSALVYTSAFAISAGGQSFVLTTLGNTPSDNLVYLNGNRSTLAFGGVKVGNQSQTQTATEYNIGNMPLALSSPYYTTDGVNAAFSVLGSTTCGNGKVLDSSASCTINVQFTPDTIGQTTQQLTVNSNGYNGGSTAINAPILTLRGTGNAAVKKKR